MTSMQAEIDARVAALDWVKSAEVADLPGHDTLLVHTRYRPNGVELSYYVRHDGIDGIGTAFAILENDLPNPSNPTAGEVDRVLADALAIPGVESVRIEALGPNEPTLRFSMPLLGAVDIPVRTGLDLRKTTAGMIAEARRRNARRRLTVMTIFGVATVARDAQDARDLVETILNGRDVVSTHRGITAMTSPSNEVVMTTIEHGNMVLTQECMLIKDLPATVASALAGRGSRGRPLHALVDHPAMRLLKVGRATWDDEGVAITPAAYRGRRMDTGLDRDAALRLSDIVMEDADRVEAVAADRTPS